MHTHNHLFQDEINMSSTPPKPWLHHKNSSSTSLSRLGLEKAIPPGKFVSVTPPASDYGRKELPPNPKVPGRHDRRRPLSDQSPVAADPKGKNIIRPQHNNRVDGTSRPSIGSKSHSLPESVSRTAHGSHRRQSAEAAKVLPPPPPPPMTKSAQKILQLTGFDPSFDQEPKSHYSVSPESSQSSGSEYSQPEREIADSGAFPNNHREAIPMPLIRGEPTTAYLQSSTYSASERSATVSELSVAAVAAASASASSLRFRDRPVKQGIKGIDLTRADPADGLTNEQFIAVEKARYERQKRSRFDDGFERDIGSRYGHELPDADRKDLVPKPLAIRSETRVIDENSKLQKHYTNLHSPKGHPYDGMSIGTRISPPTSSSKPTTKRNFDSGRHPLRSPFPFTSNPKDAEPEQRFRKKFSKAMKRLSGGKRSPVKQNVITNAERDSDGPNTPMPSNFGFKSLFPSPEQLQKGNEHIQEAVDKAKKGLKIKTAAERNRENLKKQIVVVGVTDQSPDGRVSEWL